MSYQTPINPFFTSGLKHCFTIPTAESRKHVDIHKYCGIFTRAILHGTGEVIMTAQHNDLSNSPLDRHNQHTSSACMPAGAKLHIRSFHKQETDPAMKGVSIREICTEPARSTEWDAYANAVKDGLYDR
jgi:hypothetical protein